MGGTYSTRGNMRSACKVSVDKAGKMKSRYTVGRRPKDNIKQSLWTGINWLKIKSISKYRN